MTLTQNITLDVARETALHIAGKQFDENSRFLLVTIKEAGEEKSIPAGSTITLNARRPDGSAQSFAGSIQDGKALVEIDQWILEQYGTVYCSVSVVDSSAAKLTTLSFRLLVERAEGSGFVLVYVAAANLPAGTYYITMAGVNYSFTTTQAVPAGGKIYFSSVGTTGKTTNNGATIEDLTLTAGSTGTELQGSDIVNFLTQMQANVAAIDGELDSKADKSAIEENLAAGTSLATIDPNSYTSHTTPYLHRISPSGKRCEMDIIGGTVRWNQSVKNGNFADGTAEWDGSSATLSASDGILTVTKNENTGTGVGYARQYGTHLTLNHKYIFSCEYKGIAGKQLTLFTNRLSAGMTSVIPTDSNWHTVQIIADITTMPSVDCIFWLNYDTTTGNNVAQFRNIYFIDLTTLLGSTIADYAYQLEQTTAGSGIAWLKSFGFLTKSYYPYCEPTLESVQATERKAVGINIYNPTNYVADALIDASTGAFQNKSYAWRSGYIPVFGNKNYYIGGLSTSHNSRVSYYDADYNYISRSGAGSTGSISFTAPSNCAYIAFCTYGSTSFEYRPQDVCINLSNPTINGTYYPYESHTYPLAEITLRGIPKLDSSNNIYYDGDKYKADGSVQRKYGAVDLGTLNWSYTTSYSRGVFYADLVDRKVYSSGVPNFACSLYVPNDAGGPTVLASRGNMLIGATNGAAQILVTNDSYTSAAAFKTAMSGVYLVYELSTPTTESTSSFTPIQYTGSTEAFTTSNDVPVGVNAKYYTDLTLPTLPTANGTYSLKCTVTDGTGIVSWVSE